MTINNAKTYDIAIIGGGMVGAAAAYHCARRGLSTILVERKHLAAGGSGGNFGLVLPTTGRFDVAGNLAFEKEGARRIAALTEELDFDIEYRPAHGYCLLVSEDEIAMFKPHRDNFVAKGLPERFICPQELKEEEPNLFVGPEIISALQTDEGVLNPLRLVHGLWRGAEHAGADLLCYSPVINFEKSDNKVTKIITPVETISVGQVALTGGAWTRTLGTLLDVNFPEYYILAEAVVTEPLPPLLKGFAYWGNVLRIPAEAQIANRALSEGWETLGDDVLFASYDFGTVQTRRGNILLGQMSYFSPPIRSQVSHAVIPHSAFEGLRLFPQLRKARIISSWRSPAPFTPDHLPLIGQVEPYDNVLIASGFQSAITGCHWGGEYVAYLASGEQLPEGSENIQPNAVCGEGALNAIKNVSEKPFRLPNVRRRPAFLVEVDGEMVQAYPGETVAAVLLACGKRIFSYAPDGTPRSYSCGIGRCFGCLVSVDGISNIRSCMTLAQSGMRIETGLKEAKKESARAQVALAIVGAGPAGLSAAVQAGKLGIETVVLDMHAQAGGHFYYLPPEDLQSIQSENKEAEGKTLIGQAKLAGVEIIVGAEVWGIYPEGCFRICVSGIEAKEIRADKIIIAPGAIERIRPFPGWTLPGIITAGGALSLLKNQKLLPGRKILISGTGPLQLALGAQLAANNAEVVGLLELKSKASLRGSWRSIPSLISQPQRIGEGVNYLRMLRSKRLPYLWGWSVIRAVGKDEVERAVIARVDSAGKPVPGTEKTIDLDCICIGFGLLPDSLLTRQLECLHNLHPQLPAWVPVRDEWLQTSLQGVFAVGDAADIAGKTAAILEGKLAALAVAVQMDRLSDRAAKEIAEPLRKKLRMEKDFARILNRTFDLPDDPAILVEPETVICRCECITYNQILEAVQDGATSVQAVKYHSRAGMGWCRGSTCAPIISQIIAKERSINLEHASRASIRPPLFPVALEDALDHEGLH